MVEGGGSDNFARIKALALDDPAALHRLLDVVTDAVIAYLAAQRAAGAQALMVFDTWGGMLAPHLYREFSLRTLTRSEEHTSELQSLMRISYAVFCLKKKSSCSAMSCAASKTPARIQAKIRTAHR